MRNVDVVLGSYNLIGVIIISWLYVRDKGTHEIAVSLSCQLITSMWLKLAKLLCKNISHWN